MMSKFTVKCDNGDRYSVNLGKDVLDGLPSETIMAYASKSAVINVQAVLRKGEDIDGILSILEKGGYHAATVMAYTPPPKKVHDITADDLIKAIESGKVTEDEITAILAGRK